MQEFEYFTNRPFRYVLPAVTKEMKDKIKAELTAKIQEVKDEINPINLAETP